MNSVEVTSRMEKALRHGCDRCGVVLRIRPPIDGGGVEPTRNLLQSFHTVDTENSILSTKNKSNKYSFEIWYENNEVKIFVEVPDEVSEDRYRRQLVGYFSGLDIEKMRESQEKFVRVRQGEYLAAVQLGLSRHYFEPIGTPGSGGEDSDSSVDTYQTLLNEIDRKDGTRTMVQFVYKPASERWSNGIEDYATQMEEQNISNPRWFGLLSSTVSDSKATNASNAVRSRSGKPAFHVNIRILVVSEEKEVAESHLETITNLYSTLYKSSTGQTFVPVSTRPKSIVPAMILRSQEELSIPQGLGALRYKMRGKSRTIVMTVDEMASVVHIPSSDSITIDGIEWMDKPVEGTLPPNAKSFTPPD